MQNYILEQLKALTAIPSPTGYTGQVTAYLSEQIRALGYEPQMSNKGNVSSPHLGETLPPAVSIIEE